MNNSQDKTKKAVAAALISCIIYGFSFMFSRIALLHTSGDVLLTIRFAVSMLIMLLLALIGPYTISLRGKPVGRFLLLGFCQPVLYFLGETAGIQYTNSSFAGIIISLIPVMTALLSAIFLHDRIEPRIMGWILCSVCGVVILSAAQTSSGAIQFKGIIYLLIAVFAASAFYVLSKSTSDAFTPFERTFIMMVMGFVFFTGKAIISLGGDFLPLVTEGLTDIYVMGPVAYLSVLSSVGAFMLQNYAVTYLDLAKTTVYENVIPVISLGAGILLLHEPFSLVQGAGILLCLLGVWKVTTS